MGVRNLFFILQKYCPQVIKQLPNRLHDLKGKTIVIDGTLFTQRLHFSNVPYAHRHVLGWHRLIKDMKSAGVSPICVFDSKGRPTAKARELERRRARRKLEEARALMEMERLQRLRQLEALAAQLDRVSSDDRNKIVAEINANTASVASDSLLPLLSGNGKEDALRGVVSRGTISSARSGDQVDTGTLGSPDDSLSTPGASQISRKIHDATQQQPEKPWDAKEHTILVGELESLYCNYMATRPQFSPLTVNTILPGDESPIESDSEETYKMSKTQYRLADEEGKMWLQLLSKHQTPTDQGEAEGQMQLSELLFLLESQSHSIVSMFERRRPPPGKVFAESKLILNAMGVPCLDSPEFVEGEAFAASIVRHGLADAVATEDSDVLIFETPMIKNLSNKSGPLIQVDGLEARKALELQRASFVDLALLCGTDFSQRLKNIGPQRAFKLIKKYETIETFLEDSKHKVEIPAEYMQEILAARVLFDKLPPGPTAKMVGQRTFDGPKVQELLERFGLTRVTDWDDYDAQLHGDFDDVAPPGFSEPAFSEDKTH